MSAGSLLPTRDRRDDAIEPPPPERPAQPRNQFLDNQLRLIALRTRLGLWGDAFSIG